MMRRLCLTVILGLLWSPVAAVIPGTPDHTLLWNNFSAVSVVDNFAVTSSPSGLAVFTRNDSTGYYRQVNQLFLPVYPISHKRYDSVLVVRTDADILYFVNLNALPSLEIMGEADLAGPFEDFAVIDQDLYVAKGFDGLWRYRLSGFDNPQFADSSMLGIHYTRVESYGSELYALDDYNGILRHDIRTDGVPVYRDYLFLPFQATSFVRSDSLLVVPVTGSRLLIADVSLSPPALIDTVPLLFPASRVFASDDLVAVFNRNAPTIEIFDLNDRIPVVTQLAQLPDTSLNGEMFSRSDSTLLILPGSDGGLATYRIAAGIADPVGQSVLERPGPVTALSVRDGRLFTGGAKNPLESYTLAGDGEPVYDTTFYAGLRGIGGLEFNGDTMFVMYADLTRIFMIDLTNDTLPFLGSVSPQVTGIRKIFMANRPIDTLGALFAVGSNGIELFSISDSAGVASRGILNSLDGITGAAFLDSLLFVASNKTGVRVYRLFNNFTVEYRSSISFGVQPSHITVFGNRLFAFAGRDLLVYAVSDPRQIELDTTIFLPRPVTQSSIDGSLMYTVGPSGMSVFDLGGSEPVLLDEGGLPGNLISVHHGLAAVSDGHALNIFRVLGTPTDVIDDDLVLPRIAQLYQNYPNPFNPSTTIGFSLGARTDVSLSIYNILGQQVAVLIDDVRPAGDYQIVWDGRDERGVPVASGVYFYRLVTRDVSESRKMILVK
ncbi:MAG: T9SS type A sorting domain-containing protein [candidate division Zixibacteria bacterium]|jgi:WD40 repeat protein|nr:T9SS type A sorting domain-containing protein [candidate division Zixibacteria bacterium]